MNPETVSEVERLVRKGERAQSKVDALETIISEYRTRLLEAEESRDRYDAMTRYCRVRSAEVLFGEPPYGGYFGSRFDSHTRRSYSAAELERE